jgi:hypothetical protein
MPYLSKSVYYYYNHIEPVIKGQGANEPTELSLVFRL